MPTSHYQQIPAVVEALLAAQPASILEVGIGCGKWGVLAREYLEVWDHYFEPWGQRHIRMVGIEVCDLYASNPAWAAYDEVIMGDAAAVVPLLAEHFDAALLVDVLEHFTLPEGDVLMRALLRVAGVVVVAIPATYVPTVEVWGNPHEVHQCAWTLEDFAQIGDVRVYRNADSLVVAVTAR